MVQTMKNGSDTIAYAYDPNGNITKITDANGSTTYEYDELNQLIRENNPILKKTITYSYDAGGNLTRRREYAYTTAANLPAAPQKTDTYTYDSKWKDKLIGINGKELTYDEIGNLTSYDGTTYSWNMGRQLAGVENGKSIQYAYDHTGMRVKKTVDGVTTTYHMAGTLITGETTNGETIWYNYDTQSRLISMVYNHVDYFYLRNAQGDIIALIDKAGNKVVEYKYDSWGAIVDISGSMAGNLGKKNPFRYRGYYYDEETGLYYVCSRYYNPKISRFICADITAVLDIQGDLYDKNLYAYCDNNPIVRADRGGELWISITASIIAVGGLIGAAVGAVGSIVSQYTFNGNINWKSVGVAAVGGAVGGAIAASPLSLGWQIGAGALIGGASYIADCSLNSNAIKADELLCSAVAGGISGRIGGAGANQYKTLTNTIRTASKTTAKFSAKSTQKYAAKRIASTKSWRNNRLTIAGWSSSIKFSAGTAVANTMTGVWTKLKNWFLGLF